MSLLTLKNSQISAYIRRRSSTENRLCNLLRTVDRAVAALEFKASPAAVSGLTSLWLSCQLGMVKLAASWWPHGRRAAAQFTLNVATELETIHRGTLRLPAWRLSAPLKDPEITYTLQAYGSDRLLGDAVIKISNLEILKKYSVDTQHANAAQRSQVTCAQVVFLADILENDNAEQAFEFISTVILCTATHSYRARFKYLPSERKSKLELEERMSEPQAQVALSVCIGEIELSVETLLELRTGDQLELGFPERLAVTLKNEKDQWVSGWMEFTSNGARIIVNKSLAAKKLFSNLLD